MGGCWTSQGNMDSAIQIKDTKFELLVSLRSCRRDTHRTGKRTQTQQRWQENFSCLEHTFILSVWSECQTKKKNYRLQNKWTNKQATKTPKYLKESDTL